MKRTDYALVAVENTDRDRFSQAQAYEDAIAYRRARLAAPCPHCRSRTRCDEHAADATLIASYQHAHHRTLAAAP